MSGPDLLSFASDILLLYMGKVPSDVVYQRLTGGCINDCFKISCNEGVFFLKYNQGNFEIQFKTEAQALKLLGDTKTLKVPKVLQMGRHQGSAFILMEYMESESPGPDFWGNFGQNIAELHRTTSENKQFGLPFDNFIGAIPQKNTFEKNWIDFFIKHRLDIQISLALNNNLVTLDFLHRFRKLYDQLPGLLVDEPPSLIHGDLWGGNFLYGSHGHAVLVDPAIYFGNREIELAFTMLFGGFSPAFYEGYKNAWPLQSGFEERIEIYNLYPLLVHVNLFGSSYLNHVKKVINKYVGL